MAEVLAVVGTLAGVVIGGLINYLSGRSAKEREWRLSIDKELLVMRNLAYVAYLTEFDEQVARCIQNDFPTVEERHRLRAKLNAMAFCASTKPVVIAEKMQKRLHSKMDQEGPGLIELRDEFLKWGTVDLSMMTRDLPRR